MKGLLLKDYFLYKWTYVLYFILFIVLTISSVMDEYNHSVQSIWIVATLSLALVDYLDYNQKISWVQLQHTFPLNAKQIVLSRYLLCIISIFAIVLATIISLTIVYITALVQIKYMEIFKYILSIFSAGIICTALLIPSAIKIGSKSPCKRILVVFLICVINIIISLFSEKFDMVLYVSTIASIPLLIGSYYLSYHIYRKRDF